MDSNHDKLLQRELCYHYTTGQGQLNVSFQAHRTQRKTYITHLTRSGVDPRIPAQCFLLDDKLTSLWCWSA